MLAKTGVKTYAQVTRELGGGDFEENMEQLKHENELLRDAGVNPAEGDSFMNAQTDPDDPDNNPNKED